MIDLSLCIITLNEEKNIERCLKSVQGLVNEIILVDTGSKDKTIEIAKSLNANIIRTKIEPFSFAKAKNIALKYSLGKWVIVLDADEELSKDSIPIIEEIIKTEEDKGYICDIENILPNNERGDFKSIRLFRNHPKAKYIRDCHEEIFFSLNTLNYQIVDSDIKIIHHGYNTIPEIIEQKASRNLLILLRMYNAHQHWLTAYQIGQMYLLLEEPPLARKFFKTALKDEKIAQFYKDDILKILENLSVIK